MAMKRHREDGYTLVEMLITMSLIAILASIAMPEYADMIQKSKEGGSKGNLASLRSALTIYLGDHDGVGPNCTEGPNSNVFQTALIPKYISSIPPVNNGLHPPTNAVYCDAVIVAGSVHDGQGWYYDGTLPTDTQFGSVWVACDHTDTKGTTWTSY